MTLSQSLHAAGMPVQDLLQGFLSELGADEVGPLRQVYGLVDVSLVLAAIVSSTVMTLFYIPVLFQQYPHHDCRQQLS